MIHEQKTAIDFLEWKLNHRIRSSNSSGDYVHWFPFALTKKYTTSELYDTFLAEKTKEGEK